MAKVVRQFWRENKGVLNWHYLSCLVMGRLYGLDGLRAMAAIWIVVFHAIGGARSNAYLAVDFFFTLSGYVMARGYEDRMMGRDLGRAGAFLWTRLARLYPTTCVASLVGLAWLIHTMGARAWLPALQGLLLLPLGPAGQITLNPPVWSIAYELMVNALHALLLARLGLRALLALAAVSWAILAVHTQGRGLNVTPGGMGTALTLLRALAPYCVGVALYRVWKDRPPFAMAAASTWLIMPAFFVLGSLWSLNNSLWDFLFVLVLCPLLMAGGLQHGNGSAVAKTGGAISFPLYAVHGPVLLILKGLGFGTLGQISLSLLAGVLFWALVQALSSIRRGIMTRRPAAGVTWPRPAPAGAPLPEPVVPAGREG